jgi:hypothetical protein
MMCHPPFCHEGVVPTLERERTDELSTFLPFDHHDKHAGDRQPGVWDPHVGRASVYWRHRGHYLARSEIRREPVGTVMEGNGMALAGLILGYLHLAGVLLAILIFFGALFLSVGSFWH